METAKTISSPTDIEGAINLAERAKMSPERYADELVAWCIDRNHPVASKVLIPFCIRNGEVVIEAVRRQLNTLMESRDYEGARTLIEYVTGEWNHGLALRLREQLINVAKSEDVPGEGHNAAALYVLAKHGIKIPSDLREKIPEMVRTHPELMEKLPLRAYEELGSEG